MRKSSRNYNDADVRYVTIKRNVPTIAVGDETSVSYDGIGKDIEILQRYISDDYRPQPFFVSFTERPVARGQ